MYIICLHANNNNMAIQGDHSGSFSSLSQIPRWNNREASSIEYWLKRTIC